MERKRFYYSKNGKLVRDNCLEIVAAEDSGSTTSHLFLNPEQLKLALFEKLKEEAAEVFSAKNRAELVSELADVLEVIESIKKNCEITSEEIEVARVLKKESRGGFDSGLFINWIEIAKGGRLYNYCLSNPADYPSEVND
jgi:predicted house-cleaning noncanonical NTP pyrophosphatase (MazG superfamily)